MITYLPVYSLIFYFVSIETTLDKFYKSMIVK